LQFLLLLLLLLLPASFPLYEDRWPKRFSNFLLPPKTYSIFGVFMPCPLLLSVVYLTTLLHINIASDKVKLSRCLIKHHAMNTYGDVEVKLHHSWPRHLDGTHWIGGWVGPGAGLIAVEKIKFPATAGGIELKPLSPVPRYYTTWAIPDDYSVGWQGDINEFQSIFNNKLVANIQVPSRHLRGRTEEKKEKIFPRVPCVSPTSWT
jgi:hypothetical protein